AMDLTDAADRQAKTYSGGMRRRLDIAAGLLGAPDLLFLDEPTAGLDPRARKQVWEIIRRLADAGTTILLTTQYLEEADHLADRMVVIDHGKQIAEGTAAELKASVGTGALHVRLRDPERRPDAERILTASLGVPIQRSGSDPTELSGRVNDPDQVPPALAELPRSGIGVAGFSLGQPSLDEVFLALTGHPAENGRETQEPADAAKEVAA
ncbi:MAG TPA: AAA family ATPase, partial [Micromonosporaceae bacterium]|nr:AAA family ATPase [Micromonosporaceae bacterium]